jgi:hypothetical protein
MVLRKQRLLACVMLCAAFDLPRWWWWPTAAGSSKRRGYMTVEGSKRHQPCVISYWLAILAYWVFLLLSLLLLLLLLVHLLIIANNNCYRMTHI